MLVGDRLGQGAREPVRLAARTTRCRSRSRRSGRGRAPRPRGRPTSRDLPDPGLALDERSPRARSTAASSSSARSRPRSARDRRGARPAGARWPPSPASPGERDTRIGRTGRAADGAAVLDREPLAGRPQRRLVEEDLARPGDRLDPGGGRDRRPGQRQSPRAVVARSRDDLAGRDPDPDLERLAAVAHGRAAPSRIARAAERRTEGVVVVAARPAEHREHRVADELLARPVERLDRLDHRARAASTRRRTSSGSCSATRRT